MSREFAELMLVAIVAWGLYALILALAEGLSEWLAKRVLRKGQLVEDAGDNVAEELVEDVVSRPKEPTRYVRLRSSYRSNRRQARRRWYGTQVTPGSFWALPIPFVLLGGFRTKYGKVEVGGYSSFCR